VQSRKVKKMGEFYLGEHVWEEGVELGRVVAIVAHPLNDGLGYLLMSTKGNDYSIYMGLVNTRCGLRLARVIPEAVAVEFAGVIQGGEPSKSPFGSPKKFPVVAQPEPQPEIEPDIEPEQPAETGAPYFDFV